MNESAFENGERVAVSQTCEGPDEILADKLPLELQELLERELAKREAVVVWEAVTRFALETYQHKRPEVTLAAFCFAAGMFVLEGVSITELARQLSKGHPTGHPDHITKQALSKRVVKFTEQLGLPPSRGMKSEDARESYRKAQTKPKTTQGKLP